MQYAFKTATHWIQKNAYIVSTDQGEFTVTAYRLDYKKAIEHYKKAGYTNVRIAYIGRAL